MSVRITQSSTNRSYLKNLNKSNHAMNQSMEKIETGRAFTKVSENVPDATRAMDVRTRLYKNEQMQDNVSTAVEQLSMAEGAITEMTDICSTTYSDMLRALNGSNYKSSKEAFLASLEGAKEEILRLANTDYNNKYVMGGTGTAERPFKDDGNGYMVFSGDSDDKLLSDMTSKNQELQKAGEITDPVLRAAEIERLNNIPENYYVNGEAVDKSKDNYMDIGLDMDGGRVINSKNAFKMSVDGMAAMGFGKSYVTAEEMNNIIASSVSDRDPATDPVDGDYEVSNNIYDMMTEMQKAIEDEDIDKLSAVLVNFKKQTDNLITSRSEIGVRSKYLETTLNRLENENVSLNQMQTELEGVDDATEITKFMNYQNAWNLTLRFGGNVIPKSLMDYI